MSERWTRLLHRGVFVPVGVVGRPYWKRRLGIGADRGAGTYWRHREDVVSARDLRSQR